MNSIVKKQTKTLKEALYDTIHKNPDFSIEEIAEHLDMARSYLYRAALPDPDTDGPDATGVRFPLKKLLPLVRLTGDTQVLDVMEWQAGRVAIPLPKPNGTQDQADIRSQVLRAVVEFGELMKEIELSLNDGHISEKEQLKIDREGRQVIQAICQLLDVNRG